MSEDRAALTIELMSCHDIVVVMIIMNSIDNGDAIVSNIFRG